MRLRKAEKEANRRWHREQWEWVLGGAERLPREWPEFDLNGGKVPYPLFGMFPCAERGKRCRGCVFKVKRERRCELEELVELDVRRLVPDCSCSSCTAARQRAQRRLGNVCDSEDFRVATKEW